MGNYKIEIKRSAAKEIRRLPKQEISRIIKKIQELSDEPRPEGCKKLSGDEKYRIRIGNYRVLYSIEDDVLVIYIVKVRHRKDIYKML